MTRIRCTSLTTPLALLLALLSWPARLAAQEEKGESPPAEGQQGEGADEEEAATDDESNAKYFAIVGGDVVTGTGGLLRGATVLARNGKITEIGFDVFVPENAEKLDAHGLRVYPGLVALGASSRITMGSTVAEGPGATEESEPEEEIRFDALLPVPLLSHPEAEETADEEDRVQPLQAEEGGQEEKNEIEDTFDPFNPSLVLALATGITAVQQQSAAVRLKRYEIDGVLLADRHLSSLAWSVNNPSGIRSLREKFERASAYQRELRAWKERGNKDEKEPSKRGVDATTLRILSGETLAYFRAGAREDLLGIARFAQEFGFRPVIEGCEEGWTVADELGRAGTFAIVMPRRRLPKDERFERPGGASIENAAKLHAAGVQVAVRPENTGIDTIGIAGRDVLHMPVEAGFAVRGGLSEEAALEAMTLVPARILGVDHRIGSLEVGKDLDAIVTDGDLLHYRTFVQYTVVDGKLVYDKEKELYFAHIRPRPKPPEEPAPAAVEEPPKAEEEKAEEPPGDEKKDEKKDDAKDEESGDDEAGDDDPKKDDDG